MKRIRKKCPKCHGTGICPECIGYGSTHSWAYANSYFISWYPCMTCNGSGRCPTCGGAGFIYEDEKGYD
ncbi:MAG: hypothetical protein PHY08_11080 [Candidatus Cloacimonetes bacterium]|nr:hypothetical protein [Candidatus Cloacimonadota bacterium]